MHESILFGVIGTSDSLWIQISAMHIEDKKQRGKRKEGRKERRERWREDKEKKKEEREKEGKMEVRKEKRKEIYFLQEMAAKAQRNKLCIPLL